MGLWVPISHPRRGLPVCTVGERPLPALSVPPTQSASVPPSAHPGPPSTLDRKDPGMGEAGSCLPIRVPVNSTQAVRGSVGWQVLGGEGSRPLCAPRAPTYPAIGFPREPQPPAPLLPSLVLLLNPQPALSLPWRLWAHQLGHPHPAPPPPPSSPQPWLPSSHVAEV